MPAAPIPFAPQFQNALLGWYAQGHRVMPWRDESATPYHIWLAEIMLQQTTVAAVIPYYQRFLQRFPTVQSLATAPIEDILALWQGLGYYRRAHLLHKCAQTIVQSHSGIFPGTEAELLTLPGFGPYTAAVVAATAFNQPATVVDGNVERVITRLFRIAQPLPASKPAIRTHAAALAPQGLPKASTGHRIPDAGHRLYANAIMELGSQVCTPKNPQCLICPVAAFCEARKAGDPTAYPVKTAKKALPHHVADAYLLTDPHGNIYLQQRPATGLLGGLWELPHSGWEPKSTPTANPLTRQSVNPPTPSGSVTHTFTHFKLTLNLHRATLPQIPAANAFNPQNLPPLSTLMSKALQTALTHPQT